MTKDPIIAVYTTHFGYLLHRTTNKIDKTIDNNIIPTTWPTELEIIYPSLVLWKEYPLYYNMS
jgi:hypothetical protein